jgi:hypothetical protein
MCKRQAQQMVVQLKHATILSILLGTQTYKAQAVEQNTTKRLSA